MKSYGHRGRRYPSFPTATPTADGLGRTPAPSQRVRDHPPGMPLDHIGACDHRLWRVQRRAASARLALNALGFNWQHQAAQLQARIALRGALVSGHARACGRAGAGVTAVSASVAPAARSAARLDRPSSRSDVFRQSTASTLALASCGGPNLRPGFRIIGPLHTRSICSHSRVVERPSFGVLNRPQGAARHSTIPALGLWSSMLASRIRADSSSAA